MPGGDVERDGKSTDAHFTAAVADEHLVADDQRRHGYCLAGGGITEFGAPDLFAGHRIDRDRGVVEHVVDDLPGDKYRAAVNHIAAGLVLGEWICMRIEYPARLAGPREVEGKKLIGERTHHIHG